VSEPSATASPAADAPAGAINEVTYVGKEYSFDGPDELPAGWTRLTFDNQGEAAHDMQVFSLDEGKTLQDVLAALDQGPPDWINAYGGIAAGPGEQVSYTVNLAPGNYVLMSFGGAPDGAPDVAQGMLKGFTVTGDAADDAAVELPTADVTINMVDYSFQMTGTVTAGQQSVLLTNSGTELHEAQVFKLNEGFTFEEFQQMLMASDQSESQAEPPVTQAWGMILSPGISAYGTLDLEPGEYAVVCFIPSPQNEGKPHYMLGMIQSLTVK
jgi:uncharacterized cupredoxin-like copper-binding protein